MRVGVFADLTKIPSRLTEEVLDYLRQIGSRAAEVPSYYPAHLRSIERGKTQFDEIRQTVQVVENREVFQRWLAEQRERQRTSGYSGESLAYSPRASRPDERRTEGNEIDEEDEQPKLPPVPIPWDENAGRRFRRAVILGDPGLGKTWLLRYEARRVARDSSGLLENQAARLDDFEFPIYLRLSDLNRYEKPVEEALIHIVSEGRSERFRGFVQRKLEGEGALILLDGWDEVSEREELRQRLESFVRRRPAARILVTSRIVGYETSPLPDAEELELLAFGRAEIEAFVDVWFAGDTEQGNAFLRTLDQNQAVTGLAEIPLMLALMCRAWMGEENRFPQRRSELYERCLLGLMRDWKQTKGKKSQDVVLHGAVKRLARAAEQLFSEQKEQFTESELAKALDFDLSNEREARRAQKFIDERKREGVLIAANAGATELLFLHRTFHEYLAATSLATKQWNEIEGLIDKKAWLPSWQELIVLLAGQMAEPGPLLDLLRDEERDDYFRHRLSIAAHCLPEIQENKRDRRADQVAGSIFKAWIVFAGQESEGAAKHLGSALRPIAQVNGSIQPGVRLLDWVFPLLRPSREQEILLRAFAEQNQPSADASVEVVNKFEERMRELRLQCVSLRPDWDKWDDWRTTPIAQGYIGAAAANPEILGKLQVALCNPDLMTVYDALRALAHIGRAAARPDILNQLVINLKDNRLEFSALSAVRAMGSSAAVPKVIDEVVRILGDGKLQGVTTVALQSMGLRARSKLMDYLLCRTEDDESETEGRLRAFTMLEALGVSTAAMKADDMKSFEELPRKLSGSGFEERCAALNTVSEMGATANKPDILNEVRGCLYDDDPKIRYLAGRALLSIGQTAFRADIGNELLQRLRTNDQTSRWRAAEALATIGSLAASREIVDELVARLNDADWQVRLSAAKALGQIGPLAARSDVVKELSAWLSTGRQLRRQAVQTLGRISTTHFHAGIVARLVECFDEEDAELHYEILRALGRIGAPSVQPVVLDYLIRCLQSRDVRLCRAAVEAIGKIGPAAARTDVIDWLLLRLFGPSGNTKESTVVAIDQIQKRGVRIFAGRWGGWKTAMVDQLAMMPI